jgi:hypothetical protein
MGLESMEGQPDFSPLKNVDSGSGAQTDSDLVGIGFFFPGGGGVKLI